MEKQGYRCRDCTYLGDKDKDVPFCWIRDLFTHVDPDSPKCDGFIISAEAELKGEYHGSSETRQ